MHIICTTGAEIDTMRLTPVQKEKLKNSDYYIELPAVGSHIGKWLINCEFVFEHFIPEGKYIILMIEVNVLCSVCLRFKAYKVSCLFVT